MTVPGFGTQGSDLRDQKVIPDKLTCYRRFRFRPRPGYDMDKAGMEWHHYTLGAKPYDMMTAYRAQLMGSKMASFGREYAERYYGANEWNPCLVATSHGHIAYTGGEHTAECSTTFFTSPGILVQYEKHAAPYAGCSCGFWAYYTPDFTDIGGDRTWTALAAVEVWGDVVLGTKGVRAQHMRIVGLMPPQELVDTGSYRIIAAWDKLVGELRVPQYWSKATLLEFHPEQDVSELLPKPKPAPEYPYTDYERMAMSIQYLPRTVTSLKPMVPSSSPNLWKFVHETSRGTPVPQFTYMPLPQIRQKCCMCTFEFCAETREGVDKLLAEHVLECHMEMKETS